MRSVRLPWFVRAGFSAGLELTFDSGTPSRLGETEPYLVPLMSLAGGLLIDRTMVDHAYGSQMPYLGQDLTTGQENCLILWATTPEVAMTETFPARTQPMQRAPMAADR